MKKFFFSLIFLLTFSSALLAQINLSIKVSNQWTQNGDTINACKTTPLVLTAEISYTNGDTFDATNATFTWDLGDGTTKTGKGLKVISNEFSSGAYYIRLSVTNNQQQTASTIRPLRISNQPDLSQTKANKEEICKWDKFELTGKAVKNTWEYKLNNESTLDEPSYINSASVCSSSLNFNFFELGKTLENSDTLQSITVVMEHSNQGALEIQLACPNGTTVTLKKNLGDNSYMGQPIISDVDNSQGSGYAYTWSLSPKYGTMDLVAGTVSYQYVDADGNIQTQGYLPEGTYQSYESLKKLQGCPLNGEWKLSIIDNETLKNNGYLFSWKLNFSDKVKTNLWKVETTCSSPTWKGEGISTLSTDGLVATAQKFQRLGEKEFALGNHIYTFSVKDNYGCKWDTTLTVKVTRANISTPSADSTQVDENASVSFDTDTKWGTSFLWNFGDKSSDTIQSTSHIYTDGEVPPKVYTIILKITSENQCVDYDTIHVKVKALVSELKFPNCLVIDGIANNQRFRYLEAQVATHNFLNFECKIFNRWGRLLYTWTDWKEGGWNGKIGDRYVDEGVYYYSCEYLGTDKKEGRGSGFFYVVRKKQ